VLRVCRNRSMFCSESQVGRQMVRDVHVIHDRLEEKDKSESSHSNVSSR